MPDIRSNMNLMWITVPSVPLLLAFKKNVFRTFSLEVVFLKISSNVTEIRSEIQKTKKKKKEFICRNISGYVIGKLMRYCEQSLLCCLTKVSKWRKYLDPAPWFEKIIILKNGNNLFFQKRYEGTLVGLSHTPDAYSIFFWFTQK